MKFQLKDKLFKAFLNNKQIFATTINENIGQIKGICIGFEGAGEIRKVNLSNKQGLIYKEDF